jgi:choline dehydrogenase
MKTRKNDAGQALISAQRMRDTQKVQETSVEDVQGASKATQVSTDVLEKGTQAVELGGLTAAAKKEAEFDYVIVGAGAGGAPTAARLAEAGYKVLVLEGGEEQPESLPEREVPAFHGLASEHPDLMEGGEGRFVRHFSDDKDDKKDPKYVDGKGIFYPRGEGVGGSTNVNAQIFVRVDDVDWDHIAELTGDPSWKSAEMKQWLQKVEKNEYRPILGVLHQLGETFGVEALKNRGGHGFDGWLETTRTNPSLLLRDKQLLRMVWETTKFSFKELGGFGDKLSRLFSFFDPNDDKTQGTEGLTLTPLSVTQDGKRNGPRDRLLDVAERFPERVEIRSGAKVEKAVMNDDNEVVGVKYQRDGETHVEPVGREAIFCAGTFGTTSLLFNSGIGPEDQLEKLKGKGVTPKVTLPGVGKSLSDRYEVGIVTKMKEGFELFDGAKFKPDPEDPHYLEWMKDGAGPYASNGAVIAFQAKSDPKMDDPDLYIFGVPGKFEGYYPGYSKDATADDKTFTWLVLHENKGDSKGEIVVDDSDPNGVKANFMYHKEEGTGADDKRDSDPVLAGLKMVRRLNEQYADLIETEVWPGPDCQTDDQLREKIETSSWGHHANGTAKMGADDDPMAVVDSKLRVRGTKGLRVVDASTFPDNIGSFIVSAVMQQAEKASADIIQDAREADRKEAGFNPLSIRFGQMSGDATVNDNLARALSDPAFTDDSGKLTAAGLEELTRVTKLGLYTPSELKDATRIASELAQQRDPNADLVGELRDRIADGRADQNLIMNVRARFIDAFRAGDQLPDVTDQAGKS